MLTIPADSTSLPFHPHSPPKTHTQAIATRCTSQTSVCMPEIVPVMTQALGNARQGVKDAAAAAMTACMNTVNNNDLEQFIPMLIDTMQNPIKVPDCVHKLAATTFVQVRLGAGLLPLGGVRVCWAGCFSFFAVLCGGLLPAVHSVFPFDQLIRWWSLHGLFD